MSANYIPRYRPPQKTRRRPEKERRQWIQSAHDHAHRGFCGCGYATKIERSRHTTRTALAAHATEHQRQTRRQTQNPDATAPRNDLEQVAAIHAAARQMTTGPGEDDYR